MTFVVVEFDYSQRGQTYTKLLKAFLNSVKVNAPNAKVIAKRINPPIGMREKLCFASNTKKLEVWVEELEKSDDPEICLIDCDMLVLKDPSGIFKSDFDIAYTVRKSRKPPVNGGVIFVRKNERSLQTMRHFKMINDSMYMNKGLHDHYRTKYAGMNQSAWGYMLEHGGYDAKMIEIPCAIYNAVDEDWHAIDHNTKILHVKSELRRACMIDRLPASQKLKKPWQIWQGYYSGKGSVPDVDRSVARSLKLEKNMIHQTVRYDSILESEKRKKKLSSILKKNVQEKRDNQKVIKLPKGRSVKIEELYNISGREAHKRLYVP